MPTNERIVDHGLAQDICREWVFETARWLMRWALPVAACR
jgi:hypothetical protein